MITIDSIILAAHDMGIDVVLAKRPADFKIQGIHVVEPTPEQLAKALTNAIHNKTYTVVVHSAAIWRTWKLDT